MAELRVGEAVISGTVEELQEILHKLKVGDTPEGYYKSESKGLVKISEMATAHIANTLMKIYREWAAGLKLKDFANPVEFMAVIEEGFVNQEFVKPLYAELFSRRDMTTWKDKD